MATRFYFPETEAGAVSPTIDTAAGQWDSGHTGSQLNRRLLFTADSSTLTSTAYTPDSNDHAGDTNTHHRQYVSDPLPAQTIPNSTWKAQFQGIQPNANCNQRLTIKIYVVSSDGGTVRGVLSAISRDGDNEWATSLTNRTHSGNIATLAILANDRLVVEVGTGGSPGSGSGTQGHNATIRFGGSASSGDLPEDDTQTGTTYRPWIELSALVTNVVSGTDTVAVTMPARPDPQQGTIVDVRAFLAMSESLPTGLGETAATAITGLAVAATENLPVALGEASLLEGALTPVDVTESLQVRLGEDLLDDRTLDTQLAIGLAEQAAGSGTASQAEPLPVGLADAGQVDQGATPISGTDTVALGLLELHRDLAVTGTVGLPVGLVETLAGSGTATQAEALAVVLGAETGLAQDVSPVTEKAGTETLPVGLQEAVAGAATVDQAESLATPLVEALSSLLVALAGSESLPAALVEALAGFGTATQAEALALALAELVAQAATLLGTETLPIGLEDSAATTGVATLSGTESLATPVTEVAALQTQVASAEPLPVTLVEPTDATIQLEGLLALAPLTLLEALRAAVTLPGTESLATPVIDAAVLNTVSFLAETDSLAIGLTEGTPTIETGGQIDQAVAEALAAALQELQTAAALLQQLDSLALGLSEARALAAFLAQPETTAVSLSEQLAGAGAAALAETFGITLEALTQLAAFLATAEPAGLTLVELATALTTLGSADAVALLLDDATTVLATITVVREPDEASISLAEASAILASITSVRRVGLTSVDSLMPAYTVDAVIRSWEVEMVSPFPYTVVPA